MRDLRAILRGMGGSDDDAVVAPVQADPFPPVRETPFKPVPYTFEPHCPKCGAMWWHSPITDDCMCRAAPSKHRHLVCHAETNMLVYGFGWILVNVVNT